jgi:glutathione S-transferase
MVRLYTFAISHFSEKARWAFDFEGIAYDEERLLPGPHAIKIRRLAPRSSVPVLRHGRALVQGSSAILDYAERELGATKLAPPKAASERARELEALADRAFGLGTQRIFYSVLLGQPKSIVDMWLQHGPWWGRAFYALSFPLVSRSVRKMYTIKPGAIAEAKDLFRHAFDETDRAMAAHPYLLGDRPSRVDVTVAALLAPLCRPSGHLLRWPEETEVPAELGAFIREFDGRPTWNFVHRMYRDHRRPSGAATS